MDDVAASSRWEKFKLYGPSWVEDPPTYFWYWLTRRAPENTRLSRVLYELGWMVWFRREPSLLPSGPTCIHCGLPTKKLVDRDAVRCPACAVEISGLEYARRGRARAA